MHECDQINLMVRWIPTTSGAFAIGQPSLLSHLPILAITCSQRVNNARRINKRALFIIYLFSLLTDTYSESTTDAMPKTEPHAKVRLRSYRNLENARAEASKKSRFDSESVRRRLGDTFRERFGSAPHDWQVDVSEALILGLDTVVVAGTGSGKTMPFMMPLLLDPKKKVLIISPLKLLQADQARVIQFPGLYSNDF